MQSIKPLLSFILIKINDIVKGVKENIFRSGQRGAGKHPSRRGFYGLRGFTRKSS